MRFGLFVLQNPDDARHATRDEVRQVLGELRAYLGTLLLNRHGSRVVQAVIAGGEEALLRVGGEEVPVRQVIGDRMLAMWDGLVRDPAGTHYYYHYYTNLYVTRPRSPFNKLH